MQGENLSIMRILLRMVRLKEWNADLPGCRSPVILTRNTNPESYIQWKSYTIAHAGYKPSDAQDGRVNAEIIGQSTTYSSDLLVVVGEIKLFHCSIFTDVPLRDDAVERSSHGGFPHAAMGDAMSTTKHTMSVPDKIASWMPGRFIENFVRRYRIQNCSFSAASHVMPVNDACPSCPCTEPGRHLRQLFQPCRHHEADPYPPHSSKPQWGFTCLQDIQRRHGRVCR